MLQIYEAVAYVISSMPMEEAAQSLKTFSTDILSKIHAVLNKPAVATKDDLQLIIGEDTSMHYLHLFSHNKWYTRLSRASGGHASCCEEFRGGTPCHLSEHMRRSVGIV